MRALPFTQALRSLRKRPGYTLLCVATLGLGIGSTTAIYSFVHGLLLRPFPLPDPEQLVEIHSEINGARGRLAIREVEDLNERSRLFEGFAGYTDTAAYNFAGGDGPPIEIPATIPTGNLFSVLGVDLFLGKTWPEVHDRTRSFEVVVSYDLWRNRFGSDPDIVGKQLEMDAAPYTIHGVARPGFRFPSKAGLFRCQGISSSSAAYQNRESRGRLVVARIKPGVSLTDAQREIAAISDELAREFPSTNAGVRFVVTPLREKYLGDSRPYLITLLCAVGFVLLIACVNVANLMLTRASSQRRELAVRSALGAGRWRLAQQALAESLLLASAGGIAGLTLSYVFVRMLANWVRAELPAWMEVRVDADALLFLTLVTIVVGLVTGLLPALRMSAASHSEALKEGSRGSSAGQRLNRTLILIETAATLVLLVGASLLLQSFVKLQTADVGFNPERTLAFRIALPWNAYEKVRTHEFYRNVLDRSRALPGVEAAELSSPMFLTGESSGTPIALEGQNVADWVRNPAPRFHLVTPSFLKTFEVPLLAGRHLDAHDDADSRFVCLVSRRAAEIFWPGQSAIGKRIKQNPSSETSQWMEVVGVVGNVKHGVPDEPDEPSLYAPFFQQFSLNAHVVLKTSVEPMSLLDDATRVVWSVDPEQSVFDAASMDEHIHDLIWQRSIAGRLFGAFSALALVLATVGLYGVVSYGVSERTREMGLRAAIGAQPGDLVGLVVRQGVGLTAAGIAVGGVVAVALAYSLRGLLFGVQAIDPLTFIATPVILTAVAAFACYLPARRAAGVDPVVALRQE